MSETEKWLNSHEDGYNSHAIHEIISLPKIKLQSLMSNYADYRVTLVTDEDHLNDLKTRIMKKELKELILELELQQKIQGIAIISFESDGEFIMQSYCKGRRQCFIEMYCRT